MMKDVIRPMPTVINLREPSRLYTSKKQVTLIASFTTINLDNNYYDILSTVNKEFELQKDVIAL